MIAYSPGLFLLRERLKLSEESHTVEGTDGLLCLLSAASAFLLVSTAIFCSNNTKKLVQDALINYY